MVVISLYATPKYCTTFALLSTSCTLRERSEISDWGCACLKQTLDISLAMRVTMFYPGREVCVSVMLIDSMVGSQTSSAMEVDTTAR